MCKLILAIDQYNTFSSLYFLTVMSAARYLVVLAAAKSRQVAGPRSGAGRGESGCVGACDAGRTALRDLRPARGGAGPAPVRAGLSEARSLLEAGEPPLHARARLCLPGVYHLCPLHHPAVPAASHTPHSHAKVLDRAKKP